MYLVLDTETTGLDPEARAVSIAWTVLDAAFQNVESYYFILAPDGFEVPERAFKIHGIDTETMEWNGASRESVFKHFCKDLDDCDYLVGHSVMFDFNIVRTELEAAGISINHLVAKDCICTMEETIDYCQIPKTRKSGYNFKRPSLQELHAQLFGTGFKGAHNAMIDVDVTGRCFVELKKRNIL
jgi:DNA polymerase III epsilon subunit-like protein